MSDDGGMIRIGALWESQGKNGVYFGGKFGNDARILVFPNKFKKSENQPDYIIYVAQNSQKPGSGRSSGGGYQQIQDRVEASAESSDELPF